MRMQSIGSTTEFTEQMFTVGWIVECCTMHNEVLTGEVVSFDYETKLLVLKSAASNGTGNASNIICINLDWCSDIKIIKEAAPTIPSSDNAGTGLPTATTPTTTTTTTNINNNNVIQQNHNHHSSSNCADNTKLPVIDIDKVEKRATNATHERRQLINAFKSGAGTEGVLLYISLIKTLGESVSFDSDSIIIKNSVRISPPYRPNSVAAIRSNTTKGPDDSVLFVKQLVEKYWQNKDSNLTDNGNIACGGGPAGDSGAVNVGSGVVPAPISTTTGLPPNQSPILKRNTTAASVVAGGGLSKQQQQQTAPPPPPTSVPNNNSTNNSNTSSSLSSSLPVTNNTNTNPNPSNYSKVVAASSNVPQRDHHPQHQHHHPQSQQQQQHHHHQNHPNDSATNTNKTKRSQQTNQQQQQHHSQQSSHQRNVEISHSKK